MNLQNINWKLLLANPTQADPAEYFRVFNTWIPDSPEVFVDVADYKHVHDGPVIILVGHSVNYVLDATDDKLGLLYDGRRQLEGSVTDRLQSTLLEALRAAQRLEGEALFGNRPRFATGELMLTLNNRALAPNTAETFAALKPELSKFLEKLFGAGDVTLEHKAEPRQRFAVHIRSSSQPSLADLIGKLAS